MTGPIPCIRNLWLITPDSVDAGWESIALDFVELMVYGRYEIVCHSAWGDVITLEEM